MGEPGGLPSMGMHRVGHDRSDLAAAVCQQTSYVLGTGDEEIKQKKVRKDLFLCVHKVRIRKASSKKKKKGKFIIK